MCAARTTPTAAREQYGRQYCGGERSAGQRADALVAPLASDGQRPGGRGRADLVVDLHAVLRFVRPAFLRGAASGSAMRSWA